MTSCRSGPPHDGTPAVLTAFGDWPGAEGYPLFGWHRGIDVAARPGTDVVHLELQRGRDRDALEDPPAKLVGCLDPAKSYPTERLVLTFPVRC
jgi:hypothetical protein